MAIIEKFKKLYKNLKKINFPLHTIKTFYIFLTQKMGFKTVNKKTIRLPSTNYEKNLKEYLKMKNNKNFEKYNFFDFRVNNQLIIKVINQ